MNMPVEARGCISLKVRLMLSLVLLACLGSVLVTPVQANGSPEPRVLVLLYHHLSDHPTSHGTITPEFFREHLQIIRRLGLPVISLPQLAEFLEGRRDLPPESVVITFDDGYESFYRYVYPELQALRLPAAFFVIVRPTEHPETTSQGLPHVTWGQLKEMADSGLVTVAPHTYDQHNFVDLGGGKSGAALVSRAFLPGPGRPETVEEYEARVLGDFAEADWLFEEHLGFVSPFFAFPYGRYDAWSLRLARVEGYRFIVTTRPGVVTRATDPLQIPRVNVGTPEVTGPEFEKILLGFGFGSGTRPPETGHPPGAAPAAPGSNGGK